MDGLHFVLVGIAGCFGLLYVTERARRRLAELTIEAAHATTVYRNHARWEIVRELTADEGNSVEIYCDNPEGNPNNAIAVCGDYTDWDYRRIEGDSLMNCLEEAKRMMLEDRQRCG